MIKKLKSKKYEGMGFAEALIALMIAGMVGIILMRISASTLKELAQLDMQDAIAQHAVSASVDLQRIAIADTTREDKEFSKIGDPNKCYGISANGQSINDIGVSCTDRDSYTKIKDVDNMDTDYFRIFKVVSNDEKKAVLQIITGSYKLAGEATTNTDIKDYSYLAVIVK